MRLPPEDVRLAATTGTLHAFTAVRRERALFGLFHTTRQGARVTDRGGVVRLQRKDAEVSASTVGTIARDLESIITRLTDFGDAGRAIPDVHLLAGARIINLSGLTDAEQAIALAQAELEAVPAEEPLVIIAAPRTA
jgi:hypothetical protein